MLKNMECNICCEPIFKNHKKINLDCIHTYHYKCMKAYIIHQNFEKGLQCPYCRGNSPLSLLLPSKSGKKNINMLHPLFRCKHKKCKYKEYPFNSGYCRSHKKCFFSEEDIYKISKTYYLGIRGLSEKQKEIFLFIITCLVKLRSFNSCEDLIDYIQDSHKQFLLHNHRNILLPTVKLKEFLKYLNICNQKEDDYLNIIIKNFFIQSPKKTFIQKIYDIDYERIFKM